MKKSDFFPEIDNSYADLVAPDIYELYQDTEEDLSHEERLTEIEATINEKLSTVAGHDLGELPFDEEADRKKWDQLEKEFDYVFNEAKNINN